MVTDTEEKSDVSAAKASPAKATAKPSAATPTAAKASPAKVAPAKASPASPAATPTAAKAENAPTGVRKAVKQPPADAVAKASPAKAAPAKAAPAPEFRTLRRVEDLVEAYNEMVPTALDVGMKKVNTVASFVDTKTGQLACERLHVQIQKAREEMESNVAKKTKSTKTKSAKTKSSKLDTTKKIQAVAKENPCKKGTGRHNRVQKLLDHSGKTVQAFLDKGGKSGTVLYSVRAGWIKLV